MKRIHNNPIVLPGRNDMVFYACLFAALAATFLMGMYYYYIPLQVDGGWYSYPALCLSRGGDPGENYLKVNDLKDKPGIKAIFDIGDDFRRSIRVIPMSLWFMTFGTSIWMVKLYGILEHFILLTMMFLLLRQISRDPKILFLCFAIYFMDGNALWYSSANLRPDIMITTMTLVVFLFVRMDDRTDHRLLMFFGGVLSIFFLALMRITSAISLVLLSSYFIVELCVSWHHLSSFKKWFYLSLIGAGIIGFVLRDQILDVVLSSKDAVSPVYQMEEYIYGSLNQKTILQMLAKEWHRWQGYFRLSNIGELLAILLALGLFITRGIFQTGETWKRQVLPIGLSCVFAMGTLAIFDPTGEGAGEGHALPIVSFFVLLLAVELELISVQWVRKKAVLLLLVIVLASAGARVAKGIYVAAKSAENGYSNAAVVETISGTFNSAGMNYIVMGPTELWPYFDSKSNVVIVDFRHKRDVGRLADVVQSVDFIIVDQSYAWENWEKNFLSRYPGIKLRTIREVGNPSSGWYFLKVTRP